MNIDIKITIEEPENPALAASKELVGAYLDGLTGWAKAKHDEKNSPEAEAADLRVARDAIAQQMIKAENEANDLRDDNADLADENQELNQRVDELVAELAESELHAARLEKHNLALQSANTALRTRTLKTRADLLEIGETVDVITEDSAESLPVGARLKDSDGDILVKDSDSEWYYRIYHSFPEIEEGAEDYGPFTRIDNAPDQEDTDD